MTTRDATALACLTRCEQEFEYRYVLDYAGSRDEDAPHFGSTLHVGRNVYYLREDLAAAVEAMRGFWGTYEAGDREKRTLVLAEAMMRGYAEQVGPPSRRGFRVLASEQVILSEEGTYGGILDALIEVNGEIAIDELKTTGLNPSTAFGLQYELSPQIGGYFDLGERAAGKRVAHAWIEVWHIPRAAKPKWAECFTRYGPIYYAPSLRAELREIRHYWLYMAEAIARGLQAPRMNPNACFRYNRLCPFFSACKADVDIRPAVIQSRLAAGEWVVKPWDFTKRGNG